MRQPGIRYRRRVTDAIPVDVTALPLLGTGREADVYALDADRVLRRYRHGADAVPEAEVMAYLASHGYPVPTVYHAAGPDLVMQRLDGGTMAQALLAGELTFPAGAKLLADLHHALHALPPLRPSEPAGDTVLHLDLHPENVLLTSRGPVVIDWHNATTGPADYDVAVSALILAELVVGPVEALREPVREFVAVFLKLAGGRPLTMLDRAIGKRREDQMLTGSEIANLGAAAEVVTQLAPAG